MLELFMVFNITGPILSTGKTGKTGFDAPIFTWIFGR
jgi:hypothetical protein